MKDLKPSNKRKFTSPKPKRSQLQAEGGRIDFVEIAKKAAGDKLKGDLLIETQKLKSAQSILCDRLSSLQDGVRESALIKNEKKDIEKHLYRLMSEIDNQKDEKNRSASKEYRNKSSSRNRSWQKPDVIEQNIE